MLQNLLGSTLGAPATTAPALENTVENSANIIGNALEKFDKSLINNNEAPQPAQPALPAVPASVSPLPGVVAAIEQLRVVLADLLTDPGAGSELPISGKPLPPGLQAQMVVTLQQLQQLEPHLGIVGKPLPEQGSTAPLLELDVATLQELLDSMAGLEQALLTGLPNATELGSQLDAPLAMADLQALLASVAQVPVAGNTAPDLLPVAGADLVKQPNQPALLLAKVSDALNHLRGLLQQVVFDRRGSVAPQSTLVGGSSPAATVTAAGGRAVNIPGAAVQSAPAQTGSPAQSSSSIAPQVASTGLSKGIDTTLIVNQQPARSVNAAAAAVLENMVVAPVSASGAAFAAALSQGKYALVTGNTGSDGLVAASRLLQDVPASSFAAPAAASASVAGFSAPAPHASTHTFTTQVALPVLNTQWGSQIAQRIGWLTGQGINSADIHLNPPELGPMQVRIESAEQAARVTISVHSAMTREALEMQLPRLRDLFSEQGLELVDVDVEQQDLAGGGSHAASGDDDSDRGAADSAAPEALANTDGSASNLAEPAPEARNTIVLRYALVDAYA